MDMPQTVSRKGGGIDMKKGWKLFWIICGIAASIGFACCIAAMVLGVSAEMIESRFPNGIGFIKESASIVHRGDWGDEADEERGRGGQNFDSVSSIDVDLLAGEVNIYTDSSSDKILVQTDHVDSRMKLECYVEDDELKIESTKKFFSLNHSKDAGEINIYIPEQFFLNEVSVEMAAGSLYIQNLQVKELSIEVDAGEAIIDDFYADEADFKCGAGSVRASGMAGVEVDVDCGVGEIAYTAAGREEDYNYEISCGIGEVLCGGSSYSGLGKEKEINNNAGRNMEIKCGIGKVTIDFAEGYGGYGDHDYNEHSNSSHQNNHQ